MADLSANSPAKRHTTRQPTVEFVIYFALIFLGAIPFAFVTWIRNMIRQRTLNLRGPLALAWLEAHRITPLIFSA